MNSQQHSVSPAGPSGTPSPSIASVPPAPTEAPPRTVSRAHALVRRFGSAPHQVTAVAGVDLAFHGGQFSAIMGASGSGKSTLMHLLAGLDRPTAGVVELDGQAIGTLDDNRLTDLRRTRMGFVFQAFNLVPTLTAAENIRLPASLGRGGVVLDPRWESELVNRLGIAELLDRRPHELSGGQQQRVAIARALVHRPAIVFADEPTGNLDLASGREVLSLLAMLASEQGCSVVMVTHDAVAASYADRVVFLSDGAVVREVGKTSAELIAQVMLQVVAR